jgi:hypothetical protein
MFSFLPVVLSYRASTRVESTVNFHRIGDFGFEANANFTVTFMNVGSGHLLYGLFTTEEFKLYPTRSFPVPEICAGQVAFPSLLFHLSSSNTVYKDRITYPGIYHQIIINCDDPEFIPIRTLLTVKQHFCNPSTHMDIRWQGIRKAKYYLIIGSTAFLAIWFTNWFFSCCRYIHLQVFFSCAFIITHAKTIIRYLELRRLDLMDDGGDLTTARVILACVQPSSVAFVFSAAAKGFCLTSQGLPAADILLATFFAAASIVLWSLPTIIDLQNLEMASVMLSALAGALFFREILLSVSDSIVHVWIHLMAVGRVGIDPQSTPIFQRFRMLRLFKVAIWAWIVFVGLHLFVGVFYPIPYWLSETLSDGYGLFVLVCVGVIFRIREADCEGQYGYVGECDGSRGAQPSLESLDLRGRKLPGGGAAWHPGMWLPIGPTQVAMHYGDVRPINSRESIDIAIIDDMSLDEEPLTSSS